MNTSQIIGIIPARYASTRFPGKPLALILGRPMFVHVVERAKRCKALSRVILATDDERVAAEARHHGVSFVMTSPLHQSGTDRVLEAAKVLAVSDDAIVVNIQGDEPALDPDMLSELVAPFSRPEVKVTTLARKIPESEAMDPNRVKVVWCQKTGRALYFSRAPIPYPRDGASEYWGHVGLYAFRFPVLNSFSRLEPSPLEQMEKLEQLRLLESEVPIHIVPTQHVSVGVDHPNDVPKVEALLKENTSCAPS